MKEQRSIRKIYTRTLGAFILVEFAGDLVAALGILQCKQYANSYKQVLTNVTPDMSLVDMETGRADKFSELDKSGQLITAISCTREGKFQIRVDGRTIDISPEEIKALLSTAPA